MGSGNYDIRYLSTQSLVVVLIFTATAVADSAPPQSSYKTYQHPPVYIPRPHDFPNDQLYHAHVAIQRFKTTITCDPRNITSTWIGNDICSKASYVGFYCSTPTGDDHNLTIAAVNFNGFGLCAPELQGLVEQLPDLGFFQGSSNNFGGGVPSLSDLRFRYDLIDVPRGSFYQQADASGNKDLIYLCVKISGFKLLCRYRHLAQIDAEQKRVVAHDVTNAKALLLNNNDLSGHFPPNIGSSKLSYLALANNKLSGPIPSSIGNLQDSLLEMLLLNNQLSGCLPHELGMLHKAAVIDAGMNQLTGPIPSSFSCLSSVKQLNLAGNRLYGDVPDSLCKLAGPAGRLANLTLSGNYFTSVGLACASLIKEGVLDVKNNCIPGLANQRRPAECAAFQSQPKTCPAATTQVTCPAASATNALAPAERKARDYSSYVTYATLHE